MAWRTRCLPLALLLLHIQGGRTTFQHDTEVLEMRSLPHCSHSQTVLQRLQWLTFKFPADLSLFWHIRGKNKLLLLLLWLSFVAVGKGSLACDIGASWFIIMVLTILMELLFLLMSGMVNLLLRDVDCSCCRGVESLKAFATRLYNRCPSLDSILQLSLALTMVAALLLTAAAVGAILGCLAPCACTAFLWSQSAFDSTLGFPGEGPCSICTDPGHNIRTCPFRGDQGTDMPVDLFSSPVASQQRNTFVDTYAVPAAVERARSLRGHASHGDIPSPPPHLRRINELGDSVPGSQQTERGS